MSDDYHKLAKDAGNKLRAYVLTYASAATGIFFLSLTGKDSFPIPIFQKYLLLFALLMYVVTVLLCLLELRTDARRFYYIATQLEKPVDEQHWVKNDHFKRCRLALINSSYVTSGLATGFVVWFLILRVFENGSTVC